MYQKFDIHLLQLMPLTCDRICDSHLLKLQGCARYLLKLGNVLTIYLSFLQAMNLYSNFQNRGYI